MPTFGVEHIPTQPNWVISYIRMYSVVCISVHLHCNCVCVVYLQVKGVMRDNLSKVVDRGERLDDLEQRAGQSMGVELASGLLAQYVCTYVCKCMLQCECAFGYSILFLRAV